MLFQKIRARASEILLTAAIAIVAIQTITPAFADFILDGALIAILIVAQKIKG